MLRILIVDDHAVVRRGLLQLLAEGLQQELTLDESGNGQDALRKVELHNYDLMLLDISLPGRNGLEILKQIKAGRPQLPILILSMHPEEQYAVRALKAGASGYLTKQSAPEQLVTAIRQVASGKKYLSPAVAQQLAEAISDNTDKSPHERITDREYQVLVLISAGNTLTQIAEKLNLGVATVSTYRARLLEKMGLKSTAELIRYGLEHGLAE